MNKQQIEKELSKVYKEIKSWPLVNKKLNYIIPEDEVARRQELFCLQQILYKIEDAKKGRDKSKEYFNLALYYLTKSAL